MKCDRCDNFAVEHVATREEGKTRELHLCEGCAAADKEIFRQPGILHTVNAPVRRTHSLVLAATLAFAVSLLFFLPRTDAADFDSSGATPPPARPTLLEASRKRWLIGTAVTTQQLRNPKIVTLITSQFDYLTGEFEFFPQFLHPEPGKFTFERADHVAEFAEQHHLPLTGHMLCWGQFTPTWMFEDADHHPLPRDKALANLKNHIDAVVGHFKGKVASWNVVNEAISDSPAEYLRNTAARKAIGDDYVARAFEFAHAADPDVKLYYNDYNIEDPQKLPKALKLIRSLREQKLRIDAIGIQGHWLIDYPNVDVIDTALSAFSKEQIKVMITELDIDVLPRRTSGADLSHIDSQGANPYPRGLPPDIVEAESRRYASIFKVFTAHADVISAITFWGVNDEQSWLNGFPVKGRTNYPLLFDRELQPKPAYQAVIDVLTAKFTPSAPPAPPTAHTTP